MIKKVELSINHLKKKYNINNFILSGGVASNFFLRSKFKKMCKKKKISFFAPDKNLCVDNATMIAWAGLEILANGKKGNRIHFPPKPRWRIDKL